MENLVGVRVADAAEDTWIGQGALEGVVFPSQGDTERRQICVQDLEASGVVVAETGLTADQMQRRAALRARFGQNERSRREVEGGEADLARHLVPRFSPVEPAGDHEVQDEEEIALQTDDDALAQATERGDL